ncbi:hypothetical protein EWB00_000764 [Schistosoma japonicum]|uniref:MBD domain-containing protein n=1 Tax=Schistosoma japonicum TaxID=6182 RepID=A0A4Z2DI02_SCHJA|nr:hypothetical protein EWB00_000764 [Schistosoma japonicum]
MNLFPGGSVGSFAGFLSLPQALTNASALNFVGLGIQDIGAHTPVGRNVCMGLNVPIIKTANVIPPSFGVGVVPSVPLAPTGCLNPVLCYPVAVPQTTHSAADTGTSDQSIHTIVRGPVMYKSSSNHDSIRSSSGILSSSSKTKEESPPDRIVASYAAAAHAAALACHQPISRAAEAYLATNSYNRSRHSKRCRASNRPSTSTTTSTTLFTSVNTRSSYNHISSSSNLVSALPSTSSLTSLESDYKESHKGWTRIIDRNALNVVYISSDGTRLHNIDEVYTYLSSRSSESKINSSLKELIASHFTFTPTFDGPSLEDTLNFIQRLQQSFILNNVVSQDNTATSCFTFNSDHSSTSEFLSLKRRKLSGNLFSSDDRSKEPPTSNDRQSVDCIVSTTSNTCSTQSSQLSNNSESSIAITNTLFTSFADSICKRPNDVVDDQFIQKQYSNNLDFVQNRSENENFYSLTTDAVLNDISSRIKQNLENDSDIVAKLTTETVTTGVLHTSMPSLTTEVVSSVIPPSQQVGQSATDFNLSDITSLCFNPSQGNLTVSNVLQQNSTNPLLIGQLLAIARMTHTQQQQQHNHQLSSALNISVPIQNTMGNYPTSVLTHQPLSNSILPSLTAPWLSNHHSSTQSITSAIPELAMNPAFNNLDIAAILQQHQQRQQLLALAALQQQQNQSLDLIHAAALVQQQRRNNSSNGITNAAVMALRQQQQLAMASLQAQSFLAALQQQKQFTNSQN